jgi:hypothetical protein
MHAVAPRTGAGEITIAEDQLEYKPLVGALYENQQGHTIILTRWRFTAEDRRRIAEGEDLYLGIMTFGAPLQPIDISVGPDRWVSADELESHRRILPPDQR